jgi:hypothetical protein
MALGGCPMMTCHDGAAVAPTLTGRSMIRVGGLSQGRGPPLRGVRESVRPYALGVGLDGGIVSPRESESRRSLRDWLRLLHWQLGHN